MKFATNVIDIHIRTIEPELGNPLFGVRISSMALGRLVLCTEVNRVYYRDW